MTHQVTPRNRFSGGTDSDSDPRPGLSCAESIEEDRDSVHSAAVSRKKPRCTPESSQRVQFICCSELEMEAVKHYEANPGMSYPKLVDWCYKQFDMKKRLSASTVS
jgi:hypothetical protein